MDQIYKGPNFALMFYDQHVNHSLRQLYWLNFNWQTDHYGEKDEGAIALALESRKEELKLKGLDHASKKSLQNMCGFFENLKQDIRAIQSPHDPLLLAVKRLEKTLSTQVDKATILHSWFNHCLKDCLRFHCRFTQNTEGSGYRS
ncbi:unnamed protein product [Darwinula stevensoni]|uniref:Uncharacterized protein n=1 Tax=Darwinula stevensoni TaxID=69355 RepID=A0A7R8XCL0_9CRUS|nr:unnamed protein product [Darwinula stevensoni]CAG0887837.1 unnamed protein product [Darwinula stevensoni]